MAELTAGKVRSLTAASNRAGVFTILAVDHRDAMRALLDPEKPDEVPATEMTAMKLELVAGVADLASAVLLDPEYSALQAISQRSLPGRVAFLCAVESQGYLGDPSARVTSLLDGWSVAKAKRLGAAGVKMLLLYRPDLDVAEEQDRLVSAVSGECHREEIPLFLEPVFYRAANAPFGDDRRRIVCESARRLGALGPDILKVQFPLDAAVEQDQAAWKDACDELNEACSVPWALLSGGGTFESFRDQVRVACTAGASGFLVGRALWGEAVFASPEERAAIIHDLVRPRFKELAHIASERGTDWATRHRAPTFDEHGYRRY